LGRSNRSIYAALISNSVIALAKFMAASISHSSAMTSEAIHSTIDCLNELFLLLGIYRSNKKTDKQHPFGYGKELYFWSFIVALLILGLGSGFAFYQGYQHLKNPALPVNLKWSYIVLGISMLLDGGSFLIAYKEFSKTRGDKTLWQGIRISKDPGSFMVVLEDGASVTGIIIVGACLFMSDHFKNPYFDAIASLCIGVLLAFISIVLAIESRSLLMGEGISQKTEEDIIKIVREDKSVNKFHRIFSSYQSPDDVLIVLIVSFRENMGINGINESIERIKKAITDKYGKINYILIQPQAKEKIDDGFSS
jgi:cation diffusion facilitator family transporter